MLSSVTQQAYDELDSVNQNEQYYVAAETTASLCQHESHGQDVVRRTNFTKHKQAERRQLITKACDCDVFKRVFLVCYA
jgi:hypothetical protein